MSIWVARPGRLRDVRFSDAAVFPLPLEAEGSEDDDAVFLPVQPRKQMSILIVVLQTHSFTALMLEVVVISFKTG